MEDQNLLSKNEISKIKLPDNTVCNIKDEELRRMMNILLGIEKVNTIDQKSE